MRRIMKKSVKEKVMSKMKKNNQENKGFRSLGIVNLIVRMKEVGDKEEEVKESPLIQIDPELIDLLKKILI
jgi:hypothetical protein